MIVKFKIICVLFRMYGLVYAQRIINIGGIFPENSPHLVTSFQNAARILNTSNDMLKITTTITTIDPNDSFMAQKAVCDMVSNDVAAIFGPNSPKTAGVVSSVCKKLGIPHFVGFWQSTDDPENFNGTDSFTRNLFPQAKLYSKALREIIKSYDWNYFALIYDNDDVLLKLQDTYPMNIADETMTKQTVTFYRLPRDSDDYKPLLKDISKSGVNQVMIDCSLKNTFSILEQSVNVKMMNEYVSYMITGTDGYTMDLSPLKDISGNITTIRLMNPANVDVMNAVYEFHIRSGRYYKSMTANQMTTEAALIQDAVSVFAKAFGDNATFINQFETNQFSCYDLNQEPYTSGKDLLAKVDENTVRGMTEDIHFNKDGLRDTFYIEVLELTRNNENSDYYQKFASYDTKNGMILLRNFTDFDTQATQTMQNKLFKVIMREGMPFLMKKKNINLSENMTENDTYEGFAKDLMDKIASYCKFRYEITTTVEYGTQDPVTKQWNGIIGEIVNKRADLAIGDITINQARKSAIDFSTPFMTLGISILYAKPHKEKAGLFSFMDPLSIHVWMYMATAFLCISIIEFLLAKMAANDWENPHPCDEDPEELENIWNMHNCIWLTIGSIMQQGCDILPKGVPTRLAAAVWWFFALIVISSYTANLAAFLTKEQMEESIDGVDDLANQNQIRYGLLGKGSTEAFFKNSNFSTYKKMWAVMEKSEPSVFVSTNEEGVDRVKRGNRMYAFFMESVPIKYITHRECNLTQVGGLLDSKEYGIGMPVNSPYRTSISRAILHLKEDGTIHNLTIKWWETENTLNGEPVDCNAGEKEASDTPELDMENVGGVFLVLAVGLLLAIFIGILEFIWSVRRVSIDEKITPCEAFKKEIKFACKVWLVRKPIVASSEGSSAQSSISNDAKTEEIRLNSVKSAKQNELDGY